MKWPLVSRRAFNAIVEERNRLRDGHELGVNDLSMVRTMTWAKDNPYTHDAWRRLLGKLELLRVRHPLADLGQWLRNPVSCLSDNPWLPNGASPCGVYSWCAGPEAEPPPPCPGCGSTEVV